MSAFPDIETLTDAESRLHYGRDWTRFWTPAPERVVFPRSTEDVVALVRWAGSNNRKLVPSGGRTGLSGGAVAAAGEVVVSLEKMRRQIELDAVEPSLTVEAGVPVGEVQRTAAEAGLYYPVDWAAAGSSQVGGSIATNAGGIRVLRYGMTRNWVRGLVVVDGRGRVLRLNRGLVKNNAGPDLCQLMVGSEGVLGIVTEATLGLTRPPPAQSVLLLAFADLSALMPALAALRNALSLSAFEFFDRRSVARVAAHTGSSFPLAEQADFHAVVEFDDPDGAGQDKALEAFESLVEDGHVIDGILSQSDAQAAELWRWREAITESIAPCTPYKNDLSVRVSRVPRFLQALEALVGRYYPAFEVVWFGHIGDGNLHMNILCPEAMDVADFRAACEGLSPRVFELVREHGGSISAEHGVGLLKRDYLHYCRDAAEIDALHGLKALFDPAGLLNPGKLLA
ncbi:MAG: FAD-binding oxidoreductase [Wenzhouxiangella sp.]|nr:MAG: FAD-binding oxidoreductase [Wenzhouxiangella sp.]